MLSEGIRRSLAWFDAQPERKIPDATMNREMDTVLHKWHSAIHAIGLS